MSQALGRPTSNKRPRPKPTVASPKRAATADATLGGIARCALDLPTFHRAIPRKLTLSLDHSPYAQLDDAQLQLAICAIERGAAELTQSDTVAQNVRAVASSAIEHALSRTGPALACRWWSNIGAAEHGNDPRDGAGGNMEFRKRPDSIVIEFLGNQASQAKLHAAHDVDSSETLRAFEDVCPGFEHLVYTVLELVDGEIWPVITPRVLWNDFIYGGSAKSERVCDADFAYGIVPEQTDPRELREKYGTDCVEKMSPSQVLEIYEEEVGGFLPSYFPKYFGRGAVGVWPLFGEQPRHDPIDFPTRRIHEDISIALANMACRDWCPHAPRVVLALRRMDEIVRLIRDGASLASGTYISSNTSQSAIHLWRFVPQPPRGKTVRLTENDAFQRILDEQARYPIESGETVDCAGWFIAPADSAESARAALESLEKGVVAFERALDLILQLFSPLDNHEIID